MELLVFLVMVILIEFINKYELNRYYYLLLQIPIILGVKEASNSMVESSIIQVIMFLPLFNDLIKNKISKKMVFATSVCQFLYLIFHDTNNIIELSVSIIGLLVVTVFITDFKQSIKMYKLDINDLAINLVLLFVITGLYVAFSGTMTIDVHGVYFEKAFFAFILYLFTFSSFFESSTKYIPKMINENYVILKLIVKNIMIPFMMINAFHELPFIDGHNNIVMILIVALALVGLMFVYRLIHEGFKINSILFLQFNTVTILTVWYMNRNISSSILLSMLIVNVVSYLIVRYKKTSIVDYAYIGAPFTPLFIFKFYFTYEVFERFGGLLSIITILVFILPVILMPILRTNREHGSV